jgi:hypothetical protein
MKVALATAILLAVSSGAMADNHINNALSHNGMSRTEFGPTSKLDGRSATNVPGSGAGLGSDSAKRGNLGTPGAKNGVVAPCASSTGLEEALGAGCDTPQ